jgi:ABC-type Na+ efflux pump permease subunit
MPESKKDNKRNKRFIIIIILLLILLIGFIFQKEITGLFMDRAKEDNKPVTVDRQEKVVKENPIDVLINSAKDFAIDNKYDDALYKLNKAKDHKDPEANEPLKKEIAMLIERYTKLKQASLKPSLLVKPKAKSKKRVYRKAKRAKPKRRKDIIIEFGEDDSKPLIIGDDEE